MKHIALVFGGILIGNMGFAGEPSKTSMAFLKIGPGARAQGMGEGCVGLADDYNALYWNPAGLSQLDKKGASFMFLRPFSKIEGLSYNYLSSVFPKETLVFSTSISYLSYGKEDKYGITPNYDPDPQGTWDAYDMAFSFGLGKKIRENLAFGLSLKAIRGEIDESDALGFASDCGFLYNIPTINNMRLGAVLKNIGTKIRFEEKRDPLPLCLKIGLSYFLEKRAPLTIVLDGTIPNDNSPYISLGCEYDYRNLLAIRLGFKGGPQDEESLTAGFGIKHKLLSFDFAFQPSGDLGNSYFVSIGLN